MWSAQTNKFAEQFNMDVRAEVITTSRGPVLYGVMPTWSLLHPGRTSARYRGELGLWFGECLSAGYGKLAIHRESGGL